MELGIGSYTFSWAVGTPSYPAPVNPLSAMGLLEKCREYNVSLVQICCNMPLDLMSEKQINGIRQKADEYKIVIEIGNRNVKPENLLVYLKIADRLNAKILRTMLFTEEGSPPVKQAAAWIRQVIPAFIDSGVSIAVENHDKHTSDELIELVDRVDSPHIGICLDTANCYGALESTDQALQKLSPYTINLHIKDYDIIRVSHAMGFLITGRPAGEGRLDIKRIVGKVRENGKKANVILEQWAPFLDDIEETVINEEEWARRGVFYLKSIM